MTDQPNTGSARSQSPSCIDTHHTKLQGKDRLTVTSDASPIPAWPRIALPSTHLLHASPLMHQNPPLPPIHPPPLPIPHTAPLAAPIMPTSHPHASCHLLATPSVVASLTTTAPPLWCCPRCAFSSQSHEPHLTPHPTTPNRANYAPCHANHTARLLVLAFIRQALNPPTGQPTNPL